MNLGEPPFFAIVGTFVFSAVFVWLAGTRLAIYGDELSDRLNLSHEFIGLIFLATVTELPEIVRTVTAALGGNASLVLGNLFGVITVDIYIVAVIDFLRSTRVDIMTTKTKSCASRCFVERLVGNAACDYIHWPLTGHRYSPKPRSYKLNRINR